MSSQYPKRLIEVDLPIKRISEHARREKSIRHGHISTLHIWWARRPLAACRAVLCAALWPDPADPLCPEQFRKVAREEMIKWAKGHLKLLSQDSLSRFLKVQKDTQLLHDDTQLRKVLLDFIADFSNWDNSTRKEFLDTSRMITQAAHAALGGIPSTKPLVIDLFAGGGAIPLEALRIGADAFASDLNPIPVLLNRVVLEFIPKYGDRLANEFMNLGKRIYQHAKEDLFELFPNDPDGAHPVAYLWARSVRCEGPGCGTDVPLLRSPWLARKNGRSVYLRIIPDKETKEIHFDISESSKPVSVGNGTVRNGSATCPCCGYTTPVTSVRKQLKSRSGGTLDARLLCVVTTRSDKAGKSYRLPSEHDYKSLRKAKSELERRKQSHHGPLSLIPDEEISLNEIRRISLPIYGMTTWGECFTCRQALAISLFCNYILDIEKYSHDVHDKGLLKAVQICLALAVGKAVQYNSSLCRWKASGESLVDTFGRQAIPMVWDFAEANLLGSSSGSFLSLLEWIGEMLKRTSQGSFLSGGMVHQATAQSCSLPDDMANAFVTDPPYYDAIPYAYLSDYFYVWLRRSLHQLNDDLFRTEQVPKELEIVVDRPHKLSKSTKGIDFYENELKKAFLEGCRVLRPDGISTIVFASKTTASWEAFLQSVVDAGFVVTGSWPIDTEMETRVAAQGQARLASSVHLVCRPRQDGNGRLTAHIGDWRDILLELPERIHEWLPRLAKEGIVGADAIFSCLGPALEIFSRYTRVEKASGEHVSLREYLEHVWAAVSKEALKMIFEGADATGFEEDARLTAIWLWTLSPGTNVNSISSAESESENEERDEEEVQEKNAPKISGLVLEYDAARKIAQGLGAHLENLITLVEVNGDTARLLPVSDRADYLFNKKDDKKKVEKPKVKGAKQLSFADILGKTQQGTSPYFEGEKIDFTSAKTTLDRIHQSMLLFAMGESGYLKRLLVEEGAGVDPKFWRLSQALSALYPSHTAEKRWIDGVMARKKTLGL